MDPLALTLSLPAVSMLAFSLVPSRWANLRPIGLRRSVTGLVGTQLVIAVVAMITHLAVGKPSHRLDLLRGVFDSGLTPSVYYDGVSGLMLLLVSFIGWIICRFSIRYLDGDDQQGRYYRWTAATIGAVSLMAISGNLLMFVIAWVLTSFGLHHLLLHYPDRPAAQRAAWTKFAISRVGDAALVTALILIYANFKTLDFAALFSQLSAGDAVSLGTASSLGTAFSLGTGNPLAVISCLLVAAAVLKSAQFPFHTWLPQTMETPTPVSALMHAGIVNAGGYLLIRTSPLVVHCPTSLTVLAIIGAVTAVFGGVVMMTQPSVKQALAYSTIAQMGFMMLQCGLGAFTAAMLHLLAHSLYKAHAFLGSGSVISNAAGMQGARSNDLEPRVGSVAFVGTVVVTLAVYLSVSNWLGFNFATKPGAFVFAFTLCLALITWGWRIAMLGSRITLLVGAIGLVSLCLFYMLSYVAIDNVLAGSVPTTTLASTALLVNGLVAVVFCTLFFLHVTLLRNRPPAWLHAMRVHAASGFYVDAMYRRLINSLEN